MKKQECIPSGCAMGSFLETLTRPWTLHILWVLSTNGAMRFGALRRSVEGISPRLLTERLRTLEKIGLIYREQKLTIPPAVTYGITDRMKEIEKIMDDLRRLAEKWEAEDIANRREAA